MTDHTPHDPAWHFDPMLPGALMLPAMQMWQESLKLGTACWNAMVQAWWPEHQLRHMPIRHNPDHQLTVPEPIESDGERALVA